MIYMIRRIISILLIFALSVCCVLAEEKELAMGDVDGVTESAIYSLQMRLIDLGYLEGKADGSFGSATFNAVKAFQTDNGLPATGAADPKTQQLIRAFAAGETPAPSATPDPNVYIAQGDANAEVGIIQEYMYLWGFSQNFPDDVYGSGTKEDLMRFQDFTIEEMKAFTQANATPEPTPAPTLEPDRGMFAVADEPIAVKKEIPVDGTITRDWLAYIENGFDPFFDSIRQGDSGPSVRRMQRRLVSLGYSKSGIDGTFGRHTTVALTYFQKRNDLPETGVCDRETQEVLFSDSAVNSDKVVTLYKADVSIKDQRVYIYRWTGNDYTALEHTFICSTGIEESPTITGTFQADGRNGEWYYMEEHDVWVKYAFVITGSFFFHSVLFDNQYDTSPTALSVRNLGQRASHGCVRLSEADSKWIYDNCENGMTVVIHED